MRSLASLVLATLVITLAACGDDGDGAGIDASSIDAPPGSIDAAVDAPLATSALGAACMGDGQGDCPTGYVCLNLNGASGRWCSKTCTGVQDTSCEVGYTGPGHPACIFNVTPSGGGTPVPHCAVVCEDQPGGPMLCPDAPDCNGMCPGTLRCTANLTNQQMQVVGKACL